MRLWTWRPGWDPLGELQRQVDRLFDYTAGASRQLAQAWRQHPALNLYETPTEYILVSPLVGTKGEEVDITVAGNTLTMKGERKRQGDGAPEDYRREERWLGKWSRTIQLPDKADLSQVNASLDQGLLLIRMPKAPESQPRQVQVKVSQNP